MVVRVKNLMVISYSHVMMVDFYKWVRHTIIQVIAQGTYSKQMKMVYLIGVEIGMGDHNLGNSVLELADGFLVAGGLTK